MFAVVDLETTGGSSRFDKITEIAILVHDGREVIRRFVSLVNPERPIPPYISTITGITDDMVASAPRFFEIARAVVEFTEGCTFVAHNARFDYGFLRQEFDSLGYDFTREVLCTVKFARKMVPGLGSYSLGELCKSLGIPIENRHRAQGDAEATAILLSRLLSVQEAHAEEKSLRKVGADRLPFRIRRSEVSALPSGPGLYYIYDGEGKVLHVGAGKDTRAEACSWLARAARGLIKGLDPDLPASVDGEATGGWLLTELRLLQESIHLNPPFNPRLPKPKAGWAIMAYQDQSGNERLYAGRTEKSARIIRTFAHQKEAMETLEAVLEPNALLADLPPSLRVLTAGLPARRFLLIEPGRTADELSLIGVEQGVVTGFAYLEAEMANGDPAEIFSCLKPLESHPALIAAVRRFFQYAPRPRFLVAD